MKIILRVLLSILLLGVMSCRDTKKEEAETQAAIEEIEAVEAEVEEATETVDKDVKELETALNDLDNN